MTFITKPLVEAIMPKAKEVDKYLPHLIDVMAHYKIESNLRIAHFLGQVAHESSQMNRIRENLNYSAEGLLKTFKKYFDATSAPLYAHKPEKIANRVYADRYGNRSEESGDGWRYSGRGLIQTTFYDNYMVLSTDLMYDFVKNPDGLLDPKWAVWSAGHFWNSRKLNKYADVNDVKGATKLINGGYHGLMERTTLIGQAMKALGTFK